MRQPSPPASAHHSWPEAQGSSAQVSGFLSVSLGFRVSFFFFGFRVDGRVRGFMGFRVLSAASLKLGL